MTGLQAYGCTSCLDPSVDCGSMMGKGCRVSRLGESELRVVDEDVVLHESDDEVAVCGFEPALPEHAKRAPQELTLDLRRRRRGLRRRSRRTINDNDSRQIQLREQQKKSAYAS
eukprot:GEMP01050477.1.p1 GENE.GEMP01050477.1~~GEMP01050477.1.p1  ORF type:complete len:114 (+),score=26.34 GEMP01050477.1:130-471(+)